MNLLTKPKPHVVQGTIDTLIIVGMTISPSIIGVLSALVRSKYNGLQQQFKSGEFLLYAVSFFCAAYLVFSEKTKGRKDWKSNANGFIFVFVGLTSAFYGIMLSVENPNYTVIKVASIIALVISAPTFLYSQIINNASSPDIGAQRNNEAKAIEDALN